MMTTKTCAIFCLFLLAFGGTAFGAVIVVPGDSPTIQGAITSAQNGDTIEVMPGTYTESNLSFAGKSITITGIGTADQIVVSGDRQNPVFVFETAETSASILDNLTVENGSFGISIADGCSPLLTDLVVIRNSGGLIIYGDPTCRGLWIEENWWGMWIGAGSPVITESVFKANMTGISVRSQLKDLQATKTLGGPIAPPADSIRPWDFAVTDKADGPFAEFHFCTLYGSLSDWAGGAFSAGGDSETSFARCTFYNNGENSSGLAISLYEDARLDLTNTIVWEVAGSAAIDLQYSEAGALTASYCLIKADLDGQSLFNENPDMIDPANADFRLFAYSPCVNQGDPEAPSDTDGTRSDIGFESFSLPGAVDRHLWYVSTTGDDLTGTGEQTSPFAQVQSAINFANEGDEVLVLPGQIDEIEIRYWGKGITVRGDGSASQITIRGNNVHNVFLFENGETKEASSLENMTVTNGANGVLIRAGSSVSINGLIARDNHNAGILVEGEIDIADSEFSQNDIGFSCEAISSVVATNLTASDNSIGLFFRGTVEATTLLAENNEDGIHVALGESISLTDVIARDNDELGMDLNGKFTLAGILVQDNKNGMFADAPLLGTMTDISVISNDQRGLDLRGRIMMDDFLVDQNREGIFMINGLPVDTLFVAGEDPVHLPRTALTNGVVTRSMSRGLTISGDVEIDGVEVSISFLDGVTVLIGSEVSLSDMEIYNSRGNGLTLNDETTVTDLLIHDNYRGIMVKDASKSVIRSTTITHNGFTTPWNFTGAALSVEGGGSEAHLHNCQLYDNKSSQGGAVYLRGGAFAEMINCTIYSNEAAVDGEAVFMNDATSDVSLHNSIIWGYSGAVDLYVAPNPDVLLINYCDTEVTWPGTGNISVDPQFTDAAAFDFSLPLSSPCVDAGDPDAAFNDPDGTRNDMGALPVTQSTYFESVLAGTNIRADDGIVRLTWELTVMDEGTSWDVLRSQSGDDAFAAIDANVRLIGEATFEATDLDVSAGASYDYQVKATSHDNTWTVFETETLTMPELSNALHQNHPNPFNPETKIRFDLNRAGPVRLHIYDLAGRLVRTLVDSDQEHAGRHEVEWNGTDDRGRPLASGTYFYLVKSNGFQDSKRMLLVK